VEDGVIAADREVGILGMSNCLVSFLMGVDYGRSGRCWDGVVSLFTREQAETFPSSIRADAERYLDWYERKPEPPAELRRALGCMGVAFTIDDSVPEMVAREHPELREMAAEWVAEHRRWVEEGDEV
jgi:hypothetical protein